MKKIETSYVSLEVDGEISTMTFIRRNKDTSTSVVGELQGNAADFVRSLQKKKNRKVRKLKATVASLDECIGKLRSNEQELRLAHNAQTERLERENEQLKCSPEPRIKNLEEQLAKAHAENVVLSHPEHKTYIQLLRESCDRLTTIRRLRGALDQILSVTFEQKYREDRESQVNLILSIARDAQK